MIKIGMDARMFNVNPSGIGRYLEQLLIRLIDLIPDAKFYLYSNKKIILNDKLGICTREDFRFSKIPGVIWLKYFSERIIRRDELDFFIGGKTLLPPLKNVRMISVVHDLNHVIVPETMDLANRLSMKWWFEKDVRRADFIITNSASTAERLFEFMGVKADSVIYPVFSIKVNEPGLTQALSKVNSFGDYFLSVATQEPRKNIQMLLRVFSRLKSQGFLENTKLVLVGASRGKSAYLGINKNALKKLGVIFTGYIDDNYLAALYQNALAFVFPSLYEGFGIPVLEALYFNTVVIASDLPEIREVGGNKLYYIDPYNDASLACALTQQYRNKANFYPGISLTVSDYGVLLDFLHLGGNLDH